MDNSLIKSDIFFAVTTVAVIVITVLWAVILVYALGIFRKIKKETDEIVKDVSLLRRMAEKWFGKKTNRRQKRT